MISKAYNPKSRRYTSNLPKWSAGYYDPNSNVNKLVTPFVNIYEYFENIIQSIHEDGVIKRVDTDKHPFRRWVTDIYDVLTFNTDVYKTADDFIRNVSIINGTISGEIIHLTEVNTDEDFFFPEMENGWYIADELNLDAEVIPSSLEFLSPYLVSFTPPSSPANEPGKLDYISLPDTWFPHINNNSELSIYTTEDDPNYIFVSKQITITNPNTRIKLDHQLGDRADKLTIKRDNEEILSGFIFVDTTSYIIGETFLGDLDDDGMIDSREIDLINSVMGYSRSNFSASEWDEKYSKYDIDGNGVINEKDRFVIESLLNTMSVDSSAILFDLPGQYKIEYSVPYEGAATKAIASKNNELIYLKNDELDYLKSQWPTEYVDMTYDQDKGITYYLDNLTKSVWAYEDNILGQTNDRFKLPLPLYTGIQLIGIEYNEYRIYILAKINNQYKIITLRTDIDNILQNVFIIPIHSGHTPDGFIRTRDAAGLVDPKGLAIINGCKLVTYDESKLKLLLPIYDVFYRSTDEDIKPRLNFREKYESLEIENGTVSQIYNTLWNMIDNHGEEKGLYRLPGETNITFKNRIMDVFKHFPSRDVNGAIYGISRELGQGTFDINIIPEVHLLSHSITKENKDTVKLYEDGIEIEYDEVKTIPQYMHGKYTHDKIEYIKNNVVVLTIDKDIVIK